MDGDGIVIRSMTEADLDAVAGLEVACFSIPWSRRMIQDELDNDRARYLVAAVEGQVAGYGGVWILFDEGHITNIAVHPRFRKSGIGRNLLGTMIELMKQEGVLSATLEVRRGNAAAVALYRSFGFSVEGVRRGYYTDNGEDALLMWVRFQDALNGQEE